MKTSANSETATLVHELAVTMRRAIAESPEVMARLNRFRDHGYEASIVLDAKINLVRAGRESAAAAPLTDAASGNVDGDALKMTPLDKKFLRSLKIRVEEGEE